MSSEKQYAPLLRSKEKQFRDGGSVINLSFNAKQISEWIEQHKNGDFINLVLQKRKTASEKNEFSLSLDTWKPSQDRQQARPAPAKPSNGYSGQKPETDDSSDVPF